MYKHRTIHRGVLDQNAQITLSIARLLIFNYDHAGH